MFCSNTINFLNIFIYFHVINLSNTFVILDISSPERNNRFNIKSDEKYSTNESTGKDERFSNIGNNYKSILVKRIVPHDLKPGGIEYDYKYKTFYKPLIRIHKRKEIKNREIKKENELKRNIIDKKLLEPFNYSKDKIKLLTKIYDVIKSIKSKSQRSKKPDKLLAVIQNILRMPQFEKSGEENDPLAPGKVMYNADYEPVTEKKKVWIPHYPPWNYWTYKKTIYQDVCPHNQVKLGNMCIWTPPH